MLNIFNMYILYIFCVKNVHPSRLHYLLVSFLGLQKESASQCLLDIFGYTFYVNFDDFYVHKNMCISFFE